MVEIRKTEVFARWIDGLTDPQARARILVRIERLATGNPGDVAPVREAVSELRIHPWARVSRLLQAEWQRTLILLAGGDKQTQSKDIKLALRLAKNL